MARRGMAAMAVCVCVFEANGTKHEEPRIITPGLAGVMTDGGYVGRTWGENYGYTTHSTDKSQAEGLPRAAGRGSSW